MEKGWLTVSEAAEYVAVNKHYIYDAVERGLLKHTRLLGRRSIRFKSEWLDSWMEQHTKDVLD